MRLAAMFLLLALPVHAETAPAATISAEIGRAGLAATQARLTALATPSDADRFARGGVTFLRAIEVTFQQRYTLGLTDRTGMLPLLRLPLNDNPHPAPIAPAAVVAIFSDAATTLSAAQTDLMAIPATSDFSVEIALADLWFDVDNNGARDNGEGLAEILGPAVLGFDADPSAALPVVRFDVADAAWLAAYADLLTGLCDVIRAYDPTEPLTRIVTARAALAALGPIATDPFLGSQGGLDSIDLMAAIFAILNQTPDAALMAEAQTRLLAMIDENRQFWTRVAAENDNDHEWLPNDQQTSALGIEVPQGIGTVWLGMLADFEAVLKGEKLVPYWRVGGAAGVNVGRMFTDPGPIDLAGWIQGWAALPYLESGPLISPANARAFDNLTSGQAPLFALYLN
ncbi:MAG: hypothetical protein ABI832_05480 [bacterium]